MTVLDLRGTIREALETSDSPDPAAVVDRVLKSIPRDRYVDVLRFLLSEYVKDVARRIRLRELEGIDDLARRRPQPSAKVAGIRRMGLLDQRIKVEKRYAFIGDCTVEDFVWLAANRREIAAENEAWAVKFDKYAELLRSKKAKTLRDLPPAVVEAA